MPDRNGKPPRFTLRQMQFLAEVAAHDCNITRAAAALHTTQPAISKQLAALEAALDARLLVRRANRILGLTELGGRVLASARRLLTEVDNLHGLLDDASGPQTGRLVVATTHTQAAYVLPDVLKRFARRYPHVALVVRQANEQSVAAMVRAGDADVGLAVAPPRPVEGVRTRPCYRLDRSILAPPDHPLVRARRVTLADIARHPILTLDASFAGGRKVLEAFAQRGLAPNVVLSATDSDVIKRYVEDGLGVAILPTVAYDAVRDSGLRARDVPALFEPTIVCVVLRDNAQPRGFMRDFILTLAPHFRAGMLDDDAGDAENGDAPVPTPHALARLRAQADAREHEARERADGAEKLKRRSRG